MLKPPSMLMPPSPPAPLEACELAVTSLYEKCACNEGCVVMVVLAAPALFAILIAAYMFTKLSWLRRLCPVEDITASNVERAERDDRERLALTRIQQLPSQLCGDAFAGRECSLCMESFAHGQVLRQLRCGHAYHLACIDRWLMHGQRHHDARRCPLCGTDPLQLKSTAEAGGDCARARDATQQRRGSEGAARPVLGATARRRSEPELRAAVNATARQWARGGSGAHHLL